MNRFPINKTIFITFLFLVDWISLPLTASLLVPLSIEQMAKQADWIVHGTVINQKCIQDAKGRIFTQVEIGIHDVWKGKVNANPLLVIHSGGRLNGRTSLAHEQVEYKSGEEVVVFLVRNSRGEAVTLGLCQGKFTVWNEKESKQVCNPFHGISPSPASQGMPPLSEELRRLMLSDLKAQVKGAQP